MSNIDEHIEQLKQKIKESNVEDEKKTFLALKSSYDQKQDITVPKHELFHTIHKSDCATNTENLEQFSMV